MKNFGEFLQLFEMHWRENEYALEEEDFTL